jgi:hypothetical protein
LLLLPLVGAMAAQPRLLVMVAMEGRAALGVSERAVMAEPEDQQPAVLAAMSRSPTMTPQESMPARLELSWI